MENISSESAPKKQSAFIRWAFVVGIAIVVNLFLTFLVRAIYHTPQYENFCPQMQVNEPILTKEACVAVGGQWNGNIPMKPAPQETMPAQSVPNGYCDPNFICGKNFQDMLKVYNRNVFVVFVVAGILLLVGSVIGLGGEAVTLGFSLGGVLAFVIGSMWYWSDMQEWLRVIVLGLALVSLLYFAWKKFRD